MSTLIVKTLSMTLLFTVALFAQTGGGGGGGGAGGAGGSGFAMGSLLPLMVVMFVIIYFFMLRPEQKRQKEKQKMLNNLKKGDKVITAGGIYGSIHSVKDDAIMVRIADNTVVRVTKASISNVIQEKQEEKDSKEKEKEVVSEEKK